MGEPTWACHACAGENPTGMRFCGHCGAPAGDAGAAPVAPDGPVDRAVPDVQQPVLEDVLRSFVASQVADRLVEGGGRLQEERRLVTAVFADLSGFTALAERLDPEQLLEVIDPLIHLLTEIVGRYEGYVEKFAGDALLAFFGAPTAHEDDAARALRAAMDMHRELASAVTSLPPGTGELTLHIGVNSGHVVARVIGGAVRLDYAVLGDAVILAQRLEAAAPTGETYVGEATYQLTKHDFEFDEVGPLTLKGKAAPVTPFRLLGERHHGPTARRLLGRSDEQVLLGQLVDRLVGGQGGVSVITGDAGIGKSALTEHLHRHAAGRGTRWLSARCIPYGAGLPYRPYVQILAAALGVSSQDRPERVAAALDALPAEVADRRPWFARLLGAPSAETEGLAPEAIQRGLHLAFADLFHALARVGPVAICIEDVHWLDAASLGLTEELVRLCGTEPLLLHLTGRPEADEVLAQLQPDEGARWVRLDLGPLDDAAVMELANDLLGGRAQPAVVHELIARTGGNPFFVEELLRSVAEAGATAPLEALQDLPPTIEGVLSARIDRLRSPARMVLGVASVIGRTVRLPLLRAMSPDVATIDDGLRELVDTGFLDPDPEAVDSLLFHHALVLDVAYSRLLRKQRRTLHHEVAETAERLWGVGDDHVALLARHHYLAGSERAFDLLERAGEVARRVFANEEAIVHLRRAVELADAGDPDPRLERVLLQLARLLELTGAYEEALGLYERLKDATGDVEAWRGIVSAQRLQGHHQAALASLAAAFDHVDDDCAGLAALWLELGRTHLEASQFQEAVAALRSGLDACGRSGRIGGQLLVNLALAERHLGDHRGALATARAAEQILAGTEASVAEVTALRIIGDIQYALGEHAEAASTLRRGLELAEQVGSVEELGGCLINLGMVELARGELDAAIECDERALEEFERVRHGFGRAAAHGNLAEKLLHAGRHEDATRTCDRALELARELDDPIVLADVLRTRASLHLAAGELDAAAERTAEADRLAEGHAG